MNKYYQLMWLLVLTGLTSHVVAETPDYSFVSVDYSRFSSEIEGFSDAPKGSGISFDLSVAVRPHIAIIAGYDTASADVTTSAITIDADIESILLGILVHLPINEAADFVFSISFINGNTRVDVNGDSFTDIDADGGATTLGIRVMATDILELNGFVTKKSIEDRSIFSMNLGAAYYIIESVSVDLDYLFDADGHSIVFGATKYF